MSKLTYNEFITAHAFFYGDQIRYQRRGQAFVNHLSSVRPDIVTALEGTEIDCFDDDEKLGEYASATARLW